MAGEEQVQALYAQVSVQPIPIDEPIGSLYAQVSVQPIPIDEPIGSLYAYTNALTALSPGGSFVFTMMPGVLPQ